jgi:hypothetical protein
MKLIEILYALVGVGVLVYIGSAIIVPSEPSKAVLRAAHSMGQNVTVGNRDLAFLGCSNGDTFKYDVSVEGKKIGYVCTGMFPILKGATPRFN